MPRLDFDQALDTLVLCATRLVAQLDSPELAGFYEGCAKADLDGRALRDRLAQVTDALHTAHLAQEAAIGRLRSSRAADDVHVATLDAWMDDALDKLGMASKAGVPGAADLRRGLKKSVYNHLGVGRKGLHVADLLVALRPAAPALAAFGVTERFLAVADAAVQALRPAVAEVQQSLEAQKAFTTRVAVLARDFEVVAVHVRLAHAIAGRAIGRELPDLDFSALTARKPKAA